MGNPTKFEENGGKTDHSPCNGFTVVRIASVFEQLEKTRKNTKKRRNT